MKVSDSILAGQRLTSGVLSLLLLHTQKYILGKKSVGTTMVLASYSWSRDALHYQCLEHLERKLGVFHSSVKIRGLQETLVISL
ncbi:hypothetical protein IMY05_010G0154900 [Salix suchowensis]|nr:hypothetical protein IMY05_010G0154900 [Salix suchowensis]